MKTQMIQSSLKKHPQAWYYALLACAVAFAFLGTNAFVLLQGRELVWTQDALPLYANFLVWADSTFWQQVNNAIAGQGFEMPQFTYSMGYGADVPVSMGSYLQDPINLIVFMLPDEWIGFSYSAMIFARMLLAAYAFSWYCFSRGHGRRATGIASLAYTTCGFLILLGAFRHPKFMDWAILLPLILQGADRLFQKKGPALFIVALVLQFVISIYFSYMSCIVVLLYCLIKYFFAPHERSIRDFAALVATFAVCSILAFLVSGLFSFPQIIGLLSQGRATSGGTAVPLTFTAKYYAKVAAHFIGAAGTTEGMVIGPVSTIGIIAFLLGERHFKKDERRPWLVAFTLCFAGMLIPFLGHVMNGMGYSTDRWMLALAFVCSYILCMTLPRLSRLLSADWKHITIVVGVIAGLVVVYACAQVFTADGAKGALWPLCMAVLFVVIFIGVRKNAAVNAKPLRLYALAGISIVICASLCAAFYCSPLGVNWGPSFPKSGSTWKSLTKNTPGAVAERIDDEGLWRYTLPRVYDSMKNSPLYHDVMGIDYYTSYYNQSVDNFRQELGIGDHHMNFSFVGSDSRLAIDDFTGAKYYICKSRDDWRVPFGFVDTGIEYNKYKVYRNENPVPLAFLTPSVISRSDYEQLSMVEKQETLLQGAIVDLSQLDEVMQPVQPNIESSERAFEIVKTKDMDIDGKGAHVYKADATATLRFKGLGQSETYLVLKNLGFAEYSPTKLAEIDDDAPSLKTRISDVLWTRATTYPITAIAGERTSMINPATPEHLRYGGKVDWVFNLGYSGKALREMTVKFDEPGDYSYDEMDVVCQPVAPVVENSRTCAGNALDDVQLRTNEMSARITLESEEPQIAVFTVAYSPGWTVQVDGKPAKALKVNTAFLGVQVQGIGSHEVTWSYATPGVKVGAVMTTVGLSVVLVMLLVCVIRQHMRRAKHE